jgi:hypothetical protein
MPDRAAQSLLKAPQTQCGMRTIALCQLDESHWMVEVSGVQNGQLFMNDGQAEAAALRVAEALADAGQNTRLNVYLPDGTLHRRFVALPA